jgi:ferredoxin
MNTGSAMTYTVRISNTHEDFHCAADQTLLGAMEALGRKGIPVGCRGGGCGVCKVRIDAGRVHCETMSRACVSAREQRHGHVLACRAHPLSDLTLTAVDRLAHCIQRSLARQPAASFLARASLARFPRNTNVTTTTEGDMPCR